MHMGFFFIMQVYKKTGQIKSIFHTNSNVNTAMLRLCLTDTAAHQSTQQAKQHFADFGIAANSNI